jgi:hypothetical protein
MYLVVSSFIFILFTFCFSTSSLNGAVQNFREVRAQTLRASVSGKTSIYKSSAPPIESDKTSKTDSQTFKTDSSAKKRSPFPLPN